MAEPHLEICKDCDNPMDNCRCEDWMAEDDASKPAASPVAGVSARQVELLRKAEAAIFGMSKQSLNCEHACVLINQAIELAQPSAEGDGWIAQGKITKEDVDFIKSMCFQGPDMTERQERRMHRIIDELRLMAPVAREGRES